MRRSKRKLVRSKIKPSRRSKRHCRPARVWTPDDDDGGVAAAKKASLQLPSARAKQDEGGTTKSRRPAPIPGARFGTELVGKRVCVWWPLERRSFGGRVWRFVKDQQKHLVLYDDGDCELLQMHKEQFESKAKRRSPFAHRLFHSIPTAPEHEAPRKNPIRHGRTVRLSGSQAGSAKESTDAVGGPIMASRSSSPVLVPVPDTRSSSADAANPLPAPAVSSSSSSSNGSTSSGPPRSGDIAQAATRGLVFGAASPQHLAWCKRGSMWLPCVRCEPASEAEIAEGRRHGYPTLPVPLRKEPPFRPGSRVLARQSGVHGHKEWRPAAVALARTTGTVDLIYDGSGACEINVPPRHVRVSGPPPGRDDAVTATIAYQDAVAAIEVVTEWATMAEVGTATQTTTTTTKKSRKIKAKNYKKKKKAAKLPVEPDAQEAGKAAFHLDVPGSDDMQQHGAPTSTSTPTQRLFYEYDNKQASELTGRHLRVFWPKDHAWYAGTIRSFDARTGRHTVVYDDDGEKEAICLGGETFQLAGEQPCFAFAFVRFPGTGEWSWIRTSTLRPFPGKKRAALERYQAARRSGDAAVLRGLKAVHALGLLAAPPELGQLLSAALLEHDDGDGSDVEHQEEEDGDDDDKDDDDDAAADAMKEEKKMPASLTTPPSKRRRRQKRKKIGRRGK